LNDLDDLELMGRLDPAGMLQRIAELPLQCQEAQGSLEGIEIPAHYAQARNVVIAGMGGSAIGGELVQGLIEGECRVPVMVRRDYGLPAFVGEDSLVIASSYSGNTEETLSAARCALHRGTKLLAISTGGRIMELARKHAIPWVTLSYDSVPRAAVGHSFTILLSILQSLGFISQRPQELAEAIEEMHSLQDEIRPEVPGKDNPAKALAEKLYGRMAIVYGAQHLAAVARRWKGQFNENAKAWSFFEEFPELNHNALEGYQFPVPFAKETLVAMLSSSLYHPRIGERLRVTGEVLDQHRVEHLKLEAWGASPLAQVLTAVHFGDYVSAYLAMLYGVNPSPNPAIDHLKQRLGRK
jgi:glucose/mannose-6-phosphate isomerase